MSVRRVSVSVGSVQSAIEHLQTMIVDLGERGEAQWTIQGESDNDIALEFAITDEGDLDEFPDPVVYYPST